MKLVEKAKIRTLIIGKLNNNQFNNNGFTLVELMLVIMVISVILFLAVPTTRDFLTTDSLKKASRNIVGLDKQLRVDAVRDQIDYTLNLDIPNASLWVTTNDMTAIKIEEVQKNAKHLPPRVIISDIALENSKKISDGIVKIKYGKNNVTSPAIIHIAYEEKKMTLILNPFLGITDVYDGYLK